MSYTSDLTFVPLKYMTDFINNQEVLVKTSTKQDTESEILLIDKCGFSELLSQIVSSDFTKLHRRYM